VNNFRYAFSIVFGFLLHAGVVGVEHNQDRKDLVMCLVETSRVLEGLEDCVGLMESTRDLDLSESACLEVLEYEAAFEVGRLCP
jgi:hypothetical protein